MMSRKSRLRAGRVIDGFAGLDPVSSFDRSRGVYEPPSATPALRAPTSLPAVPRVLWIHSSRPKVLRQACTSSQATRLGPLCVVLKSFPLSQLYPTGSTDVSFETGSSLPIKRPDGIFEVAYDRWILGRAAEPTRSRWPAIGRVLGWIYQDPPRSVRVVKGATYRCDSQVVPLLPRPVDSRDQRRSTGCMDEVARLLNSTFHIRMGGWGYPYSPTAACR